MVVITEAYRRRLFGDATGIGEAIKFNGVPAVVIGGVGTIAVALVWMALFPDLRRLRTFEE